MSMHMYLLSKKYYTILNKSIYPNMSHKQIDEAVNLGHSMQ